MDQVSFVRLSRRVREMLGHTQEQFARALGVSLATVQNWESGRKRPSPARLEQMGELAPKLGAEIREEIGRYSWRRSSGGVKHQSRYREETRQALLSALDMILERAPSAVVENVIDFISERAAKYGSPREEKQPARPRSGVRHIR